jgi:hypothetical protein
MPGLRVAMAAPSIQTDTQDCAIHAFKRAKPDESTSTGGDSRSMCELAILTNWISDSNDWHRVFRRAICRDSNIWSSFCVLMTRLMSHLPNDIVTESLKSMICLRKHPREYTNCYCRREHEHCRRLCSPPKAVGFMFYARMVNGAPGPAQQHLPVHFH